MTALHSTDAEARLIRYLHIMCDSISDVTHYPPPQDFIDGSPGHLLQQATKAPTIHLVGVLMAYQRVHYVVQMLRVKS